MAVLPHGDATRVEWMASAHLKFTETNMLHRTAHWFLLLVGWMALTSARSAVAQVAPDARPNIIFAIADDWGYPHAGAYGYKAAKTPTFDRLATQGMLFNRAYCAAPSCTASRGSILTGQAPHRLENGGDLWSHLPAKFTVYPDLLERAGYVVGARQKAWGPGKVIDRPRPPAGPDFKSFDQFLKTVPTGKPFCFWFGSHDPHRPYVRAFTEKSGIDPKDVVVPPYLPDTPEVRMDIVDYLAEVQRFDTELGEVMASLKAAGKDGNTFVIVTGDNGWPWPHGKANLYDPGVHQPFVAYWPGKIKAGTRTDYLTSLTDLAPTFLAAAGVEIPKDMTGQNLLPVLLDQNPPPRHAIFVERERHARAREENTSYPSRAVITDRYLFIRNFEPGRWPAGDPTYPGIMGMFGDIDNGPTKQELLKNRDDPNFAKFFHLATDKRAREELFDLKADPNCLNDLADNSDFQDAKKQLRSDVETWMKETADPRAANPHDDRWDKYEYHGDKAK
jgi:N-sulfoglucosamine sulfohydrolase